MTNTSTSKYLIGDLTLTATSTVAKLAPHKTMRRAAQEFV